MEKDKDLMSTMQELADHTMHRSMGRMFHFGKSHNLSFSQMIILHMLYRAEKHRPDQEITVSHISEHMDISNSAVSQLLKKLLQSDYILFQEDREDRRKKKLLISDKGKEMVRLSHKARSAWVKELIELFSQEEAESLKEPLELFLEKLKGLDPPPHKHHHHKEKDKC